MAFTIQNWARASASANEPIVTPTSGNNIGCFREYIYYSPVDTQATCSASSYFNTVAYDLVTNDKIQVFSLTEGTYVSYIVTNTAGTITLSVPNVGLGSSQYAQVAISNAAFLTLYSVGTQLVAAPGAGLALLVDRVQLQFVYGSAQSTNGGAVAVQWASTIHQGGTLATGTVAAATLNGYTANTEIGFSIVATGIATANIINLPLYLTAATQDFTVGTGSTMLIDVWYRTVAMS